MAKYLVGSETVMQLGLIILSIFIFVPSTTGEELSSTVESNETVQYHYVCPKNFQNIGKKCYHFSNSTATWFQAFFSCKDLDNSTLSVFSERYDQRQLESFLFKNRDRNRALAANSLWVGGFKDWKQKRWIYTDGSPVQFPSLRDIDLSLDDKWTCLLIDTNRKRWRAENCMARRPYICETSVLGSIILTVEDKKVKRKISIDECISNTDNLTKKQKRKCLKMLDNRKNDNGDYNNEPAAVIQKAKPAYPTQPTVFKAISHICPQNWMSIGSQCYLLSKEKVTWSEAHFNCGQINSKLAVIRTKVQDQKLRIFLNGFTEKQERWIGGRYNVKKGEWIWALTGRRLKYSGFAKEVLDNETSIRDWQAILMDPQYSYQWNHRNEMEKHFYICQVKGRAVKRLTYPKRPAATIEIMPDNRYPKRNPRKGVKSNERGIRRKRT